MFLVVLLHANFWSIGEPTQTDAMSTPVTTIIRVFIQSATLTCVNIFIMISGWFGIRPKMKSILKFIFQCVYICFFVNLLFIMFSDEVFSATTIKECLYISRTDYFVKAYIVLYLFAPALNALIDSNNEKIISVIIIGIFIYQTFYGWLFQTAETGRMMHFCSLYLLARYTAVHKPFYSNFSKAKDVMIILICILGLTIMYIAPLIIGMEMGSLAERYWSYINPLCIIAALYVIFLFSKIHINRGERFIMFASVSCFSVYLININLLVQPYFKYYFQNLYYNYLALPFWGITLLSVVVFFIVCVLIDKIRLVFWNVIVRVRASIN